jgi:cysteine desulfurase
MVSEMQKKVYLDNAATTMVDPKVAEKIIPFFTQKYGNASSLNSLGIEAKEELDYSRKIIADSINADEKEIIFTSSGTESNNIALKSIAFSNKDKGNHIITTRIEHKSVLEVCKWLEKNGFKVTYLDVDNFGFVDLKSLEKAITSKTILISIIHGNNEIGTIQDLKKIGEICKKNKVYLHIDACQSYTKTEIDVKKINVDLISLNAHKIHGPKGVGALYIKKGTNLKTWQHGGSQEFNLRTGTENIPGIVGFRESVKLASSNHIDYMAKLRDKLINDILKKIPYSKLNGPTGNSRLCNNINVSFKAIEGEALIEYLDLEGFSCSTGSACSSKSLDPSYVLMALGLSHEDANGSIRISLSRFNTEEELKLFVDKLREVVDRLRKMSPIKIKPDAK